MNISFEYSEFKTLQDSIRDIERALEKFSVEDWSLPSCKEEIEQMLKTMSYETSAAEIYHIVLSLAEIKRIIN